MRATAVGGGSDAGPAVDGRRLRRERGRQAVIDAMVDLALEGHAPPTAEQVIDRAGVSQASLFRYFPTLDDLRREAVDRWMERCDDLIAIPDIGVGPLADRIARFVAARDAFYERTAPMARLMRRQGDDIAIVAETIDRVRSTFADQATAHFAGELDRLAPAARRRRIAVLGTLTSFEAWEQLASLGERGRRAALRETLGELLA